MILKSTQKQNDYILEHGGLQNLREADLDCNDLNREQIAEFRDIHGTAFLGRTNFYGEERKQVLAGKNIYTEYTGQEIYNFSCSFCVPTQDEVLEQMIREWNGDNTDRTVSRAERITNQVEKIGGINLIWF